MIDIEIKGLQSLQKRLKNMPNDIAKAQNAALRRTSRKSREAARKEAERVFDKPRPQTIKAIENRWPTVQQLKSGKGEASVFIKSYLVNSIHPQVFKQTETALPKSSKSVLIPTKHARRDKHGGIAGIRGGSVERQRAKRDQFLSVPIDNKNPKTKHLKPGLYRIMGGKNRGKRRSQQKLRAIYYYKDSIRLQPKFRNYGKVAIEAYQKHYKPEFLNALSEQLTKNKRR